MKTSTVLYDLELLVNGDKRAFLKFSLKYNFYIQIKLVLHCLCSESLKHVQQKHRGYQYQMYRTALWKSGLTFFSNKIKSPFHTVAQLVLNCSYTVQMQKLFLP